MREGGEEEGEKMRECKRGQTLTASAPCSVLFGDEALAKEAEYCCHGTVLVSEGAPSAPCTMGFTSCGAAPSLATSRRRAAPLVPFVGGL